MGTFYPIKVYCTAWKLPATASIITAELALPFALFLDSLTALQIIKSHCPHSHHNLILIIHHLIFHLTSQGDNIHLQWVPSHVGVRGNMVTNRAEVEAYTHPSHIDLATDLTTTC